MVLESLYQKHLSDLKSSAVSCESLVKEFTSRIAQHADLNCFLEVWEDWANNRAKELDQKYQSGQPIGKLFGMVIAVKDNIVVKGKYCSASSKILQNFVSPYSATVIERLLAEDAILIGRTNCDEFAMGSSNENSAFGPVKNFLDKTRVPGGSSGGSAVAVQADLCHAALGSDTGGSIRQPASFCGLIGYKPTYGLVSRYGLIAYASSFDQIGPLTKSISDLNLILEVICGIDNNDNTSSPISLSETKVLKSPENVKIAYFDSILNHEGLNPKVKAGMDATITKLKNQGHQVTPVSFPYLDFLIPVYYILTTAEASSNLARFDGIRYGYRDKEAANIESVYTKSRAKGFGPEVQNRIMLGTFVLSSGYYDAFYSKGQKMRRLLVNELNNVFSNYDIIITPTAPDVAFTFGATGDDPVAMYLSDIYTVLANITGIPAISLPLMKGENDLPAGVQLMSKSFSDQSLLSFSDYLINLS